jgi:hypothetical protein
MLTAQALSSVWALLPPLNVLLFSAIIPEQQTPAAMQTSNYSVHCLPLLEVVEISISLLEPEPVLSGLHWYQTISDLNMQSSSGSTLSTMINVTWILRPQNNVTRKGFAWRIIMGSGLDDWFYCHLYRYTVRDYRHYSAIAILHISQLTVAHALGFSVFTCRILATDL